MTVFNRELKIYKRKKFIRDRDDYANNRIYVWPKNENRNRSFNSKRTRNTQRATSLTNLGDSVSSIQYLVEVRSNLYLNLNNKEHGKIFPSLGAKGRTGNW